MKKKLIARYNEIIKKMNDLETVHLYWLKDDWKRLLSQKTLLIDILGE